MAVDFQGTPVYAGLSVGSFAEEIVIPAAAAFPVPEDIASTDAALLGCAVTTGIGAVIKTAKVRPGSTVAVIGLGGVGLSAVRGARLAEASRIIAIDRNPDKGALALSMGADEFVRADDDTKKAVRSLTDGQGADYAFDCVGSARTIRSAWSLTRRGGHVCVVGIGTAQEEVTFSALELFHFARSLTGCVAGSLDAPADFPRFFEWVRHGELDLSLLVTESAGLADVDVALRRLEQGDGARTLLYAGATGAVK